MTRSLAGRILDVALLLVVSLLALAPFGDAYAGHRWLAAAAGGLLLAIGVTALAHHRRWGPLLTVLVATLGYLLFGPLLAAPQQAIGGWLPSPTAERALLTGLVESWRSVLTQPVPLGSSRGELVVPLVTALLGGLIAAALLLRSRYAGLVCLPVVAMFASAAAFGTQDADLPLGRGLLLAVLLLGWLQWRTIRASRASWARRVGLAGVLVALTGSAAWGMTSLGASGDRDVLRQHIDPPLAELDFKSPLAKYRDYYLHHKTDVLFTIQGLPAGAPEIPLAAMDSYDGFVWNVSTTDATTGTGAFREAPWADGGSEITVTVDKAAGPWVPTVGVGAGALLDHAGAGGGSRQLLLNPATGSVAMYGDVRAGDVYRVEWTPSGRRTDDLSEVPADRTIDIPAAPQVPVIDRLVQLTQRAITRAGVHGDYDRAVAIEAFFHDNGYFNDGDDPVKRGYSAPGHSVRRLVDLVADDKRMVGNDEQYAAAMAYALQRLGMPARVMLGFRGVGSDGVVTGDDIAAWVEVPFVGRGWIDFNPTPDENRIPPPKDQDPNPKPQPYVVQPPILPQEPANVDGVPPEGGGRDLADRIWGLLWVILRWVGRGLEVVLLLAPLWVIVLVKRVRRRRRRRAEDPVQRLSGAWREVTDRARDLGAKVSAGHTRRENALVLAARFPECEHPVLAATADRHVFGPGQPSDEDVTAYWADVDTALRRMRRAVPWWRRPLAWISPMSIPWRAAGAGVRARLARTAGRLRPRLRRRG